VSWLSLNWNLRLHDAAIRLDPNDPDYHQEKGIALSGLGKFDEALKEYDVAIKLDPKNPDYHKFRENALNQLKRFDAPSKTCTICGKKFGEDDAEARVSSLPSGETVTYCSECLPMMLSEFLS
jgi:tetratricopeptide (TPR) repeat protein